MADDFQFGERAKHPARLGGPRPPRPKSSIPFKLVGVVVVLVVAAAAAFVFLRGADEAGTETADARSETSRRSIGRTDAAAQGTMGRAVVVARTCTPSRGPSPPISRRSRRSTRVSVHLRPVDGPQTVSYVVSGASSRPRSDRNRCLLVGEDRRGQRSMQGGATCTGAPLCTSVPSW